MLLYHTCVKLFLLKTVPLAFFLFGRLAFCEFHACDVAFCYLHTLLWLRLYVLLRSIVLCRRRSSHVLLNCQPLIQSPVRTLVCSDCSFTEGLTFISHLSEALSDPFQCAYPLNVLYKGHLLPCTWKPSVSKIAVLLILYSVMFISLNIVPISDCTQTSWNVWKFVWSMWIRRIWSRISLSLTVFGFYFECCISTFSSALTEKSDFETDKVSVRLQKNCSCREGRSHY